jgi:hypothetical protein
VPEKAIARVDELVASDAVKIATRVMAPNGSNALAAPAAKAAIAAPTPAPAKPAVDDAYEEEAATPQPEPIQAKAAPTKPTVAPVKASDELAAKIDSLFDE